jgi:hypothetical protein
MASAEDKEHQRLERAHEIAERIARELQHDLDVSLVVQRTLREAQQKKNATS